jgi:hypothetical protein
METPMTKTSRVLAGTILSAGLMVGPAAAQELMGFNLSGSFGEGGFSRYVPPVTMPTLNESPFITTEVKPIFI